MQQYSESDIIAFILIGLVLIGSILFTAFSPWPARCQECPSVSEHMDGSG
jgi:hypothetical protein